MLEEIRISSLGVIESSALELGPGLTVITGETGAGKTMIVTALGLLMGGRADSGAVRSGARSARVECVISAAAIPGLADAVDDLGGEVEDGRVVLARNITSEGRSRAFVGGASVPASSLAEVAEPLVAIHGQSDQHRLLKTRAQREALDRFGGSDVDDLVSEWSALHLRLTTVERELTDVVATARERAREADLLRFGLGEIEAVSPASGEDVTLLPRRPGWVSRTPCGRLPSKPERPCPRNRGPRTRWARRPPRAVCSKASRSTMPRRRNWPDGWPR